MLTSPLVIVACGRAKRDVPSEARELYVGSYASACVRFGEVLAANLQGSWMILSAKYGFLPPRKILEPYNVTFGDEDAIGIDELRHQAERSIGFDRRVLVVGGARYLTMARAIWVAAEPVIPVDVGGIGHQLGWLKANQPAHLYTECSICRGRHPNDDRHPCE